MNKLPKSKWVVNVEDSAFDIYIGREKGSLYGNPYRVGPFDNRTMIIRRYGQWLMEQSDLVRQVKSNLCSRILACHCRPLSCHGDVLAAIANNEEDLIFNFLYG